MSRILIDKITLA